jgi:hypothetical protein
MEYKSFMEALKGKQHKIDKNKNGKVDAHDFELLRKEETEQLEEATVKTQKYSWGTMKTVHHGSDFSIPLHPEHHKAIAKLKDQQEHKFKTEDGKHWTAKRSGEDVHFQSANDGPKTTVKHSTMSEEVQIDEIRRMKTKLNSLDDISNKSVARQKLSNLMKSGKARGALIANKMRTLNMGDDVDQEDLNALHEVLSKDAKAGDWIHDFVHSDNPKFEGKTKKERIKMALGAYYGKQNEAYQSYSGPSHGHAYGRSGFGRRAREDDEGYSNERKPMYPADNPTNTPRKPQKPEVKENAPVAPVPDRKYIKGTPEHKAYKATKKPINGMPTNVKEEVLDEANHREFASQGLMHPDMVKHMKTGQETDFYHSKTGDKISGVVKHVSPTEVHIKAHKDGKMAAGDVHKFKVSSNLQEDKMTTTKDKEGKLVSFKYEGDWKKATEKKQGSGKAANLAGQAMQKMAKANEAKEDPGEYDQEGDMAKTQLRSIKYHADELHEMLSDNDNLPEWVQSKLTLAQDYLQTVCDYMYSKDEVNEEKKSVEVKVNAAGDEPHEEKWEPAKKAKKPVSEAAQKVDIPAYLRKAKGDTPLKMDDLKRKDTISDPENLKRNRGVKESFDDEGNLITNKISYKEFMLEYTPGPGGVTQIKGRSYGANYSDPEGADDADDNKPMKPAAEKRGRGRPAGAKSGARKITGTSKLMNK